MKWSKCAVVVGIVDNFQVLCLLRVVEKFL